MGSQFCEFRQNTITVGDAIVKILQMYVACTVWKLPATRFKMAKHSGLSLCLNNVDVMNVHKTVFFNKHKVVLKNV